MFLLATASSMAVVQVNLVVKKANKSCRLFNSLGSGVESLLSLRVAAQLGCCELLMVTNILGSALCGIA